jgi:hypothetical protein
MNTLRPALSTGSPVRIFSVRCIAFASLRKVADRLKISAGIDFSTLRRLASQAFQVGALIAGATVIRED